MLPKDPAKQREYRFNNKLLHLLKRALGATSYKGGRPKGIPAWNKDKKNVELFGEEKAAQLSKIQGENAKRTRNHLGHHHSPEAIEKMRIASTGRVSPNKGNPTNYRHTEERKDKIRKANARYWEEFWKTHPAESRYRKRYKWWQGEVKKRDGYACQHCGITEDMLPKNSSNPADSYLHCHHIKSWREYPTLRYVVSNGFTMCPRCHRIEETRLASERKTKAA
jgi:5-methylcytosine-specific restriction endonuclease McrA